VQYCINDPNTIERSDKIVDMSKLDATVDKITLQMQRFTTLQTSVEKSDCKDRLFEKSKLIEEIDKLVEIEREKEEDKGKHLKIASPTSADSKEIIQGRRCLQNTVIYVSD
jgi:hypothetical protein